MIHAWDLASAVFAVTTWFVGVAAARAAVRWWRRPPTVPEHWLVRCAHERYFASFDMEVVEFERVVEAALRDIEEARDAASQRPSPDELERRRWMPSEPYVLRSGEMPCVFHITELRGYHRATRR